jgi:hypothetical protein
MPSLEERQLANLAFFLRDRPQFMSHESHEIGLSEAYLSFGWLETFLWLHLGVHMEYFPKPESRRAIYEYFPFFLKSYEYVLSSRLSQKLSPPLVSMLDSQFNGRSEIFARDETLQPWPNMVEVSLRDAIIMANGFENNIHTQTFVDSLEFKNTPQWEDFVRFTPVVDRFSEAHPTLQERRDAVLSGFLKCVEYMETFHWMLKQFDEVADKHDKATSTGLAMMKQRIAEVQRWRLNFADSVVYDRFIQLVNGVASQANGFFSSFEQQRAFVSEIKLLMIDWGGPRLALEAGA